MKKVYLDSFIKKDDFNAEFTDGAQTNSVKSTISVNELEKDSFFLNSLRKPDFQRESNDWSMDKIVEFIDSFVNNELIPSIILWKNQNNLVFIIDGAHRLSAICAWINDDYGDGEISRKYYADFIPEEQLEIAVEVRKKINSTIGSYQEYKNKTIASRGQNFEKRLNNLGSIGIAIQWVYGDSKKAEDSFIKINQKTTPIGERELEIIKDRDLTYSICTRLILRAAKGHDYISKIDDFEQRKEINQLASNVHNLMFGIKKLNMNDLNSLPIAGSLSSSHTLDVIAQTIHICNNEDKGLLKSEATFTNIIKTLKNCKRILSYVFSKEPYSLGLHPYTYFYNDIGGHKIGNYYGIIRMLSLINGDTDKLNKFVRNREQLEKIIVKYSFIFQQIQRKWRQSKRAYKEVGQFYLDLIDVIDNKENEEKIIEEMSETYNFLDFSIVDNSESSKKSTFSSGKRKVIKTLELASHIPKCAICQGYLSPNSASVDHIIRKQDGGDASLSNGQLTHFYCNTTFKEMKQKAKL